MSRECSKYQKKELLHPVIIEISAQEACIFLSSRLLTGKPLVRFELIEIEVRPYLLMDFHHCISDGISIDTIFSAEDLSLAYDGQVLSGPEYGLYEATEQEQASFDTEEYRQAQAYYAENWNGVSFSAFPQQRPFMLR